MHAVDAGYTPTHFQLHTAPAELQYKLRVIFDGVDADAFQRRPVAKPTVFCSVSIPANTRVVTYVSRGLESVRGFDIFMEVAKRIYQEMPNVLFLIAGRERTNYGHERAYLGGQSFKDHVLSRGHYDLSKFHFLGLIPTHELPTLFSLSDLHIYLTGNYVLSWSLIQAMSTGCTILGSATPPLQEVIEDGVHGLPNDFADVEGLPAARRQVLRDPGQYRPLGEAARHACWSVESVPLRRAAGPTVRGCGRGLPAGPPPGEPPRASPHRQVGKLEVAALRRVSLIPRALSTAPAVASWIFHFHQTTPLVFVRFTAALRTTREIDTTATARSPAT